MDTFFPTSTPAMLHETVQEAFDRQAVEIDNLKKSNDRWQSDYTYLQRKIENVKGYIIDQYSMEGRISDDLAEIAALLDINLTKRVRGTMTIEVEYDFDAPLGFDNDDLELSYTIDCDSHEVDNFDWNEVSADWSSEDED